MDKPKFDGIEKYIFADAYVLLTKYIDGDGRSDQFWGSCVNDARELNKKYRGNKLCLDLVLAVMDDIEYKFNGSIDKTGRVYKDWEAVKESIKTNKNN